MTVSSLQYIALAVPDPEVGRTFYTDFGLEARDAGDKLIMRCHGRDQDQVVLLGGKQKHMHHICFGAKAEALPGLKQRLEANDTRLVDAPNETPGDGVWFRDPDGLLVNVRPAKSAPWLDAPEMKFNNPGHLNRAGVPGHPKRDMAIRPRRLGHVLRFSPNFEQQVEFYGRVVGLKLSDRAQNMVAFMRGGEGTSDHHIFGFIAGDRPGFHHASFEVGSIDEIGLGACRLLEKGYRDGWGFGRHVIGSNFFHYIRDPWNSMAEYFCDIDVIPADSAWQATNYPLEDSLYVWGPQVPEEFGVNYEAAD